MTAAANALVECEVGGTVVPIKRSPTCRTCRSGARRDVETAMAQGRSYAEIVTLFPGSGLTTRHLSEHYRRGHLPLHSPQVRRVVAEAAEEASAILRVAVDAQAEAVVLARRVVAGVSERLATGELEPTFRDAVAAARLLAEYDSAVIERDELRGEVQRTHDGMRSLLRLVRGKVSDEAWSAVSRAVDLDADLRVFLAANRV